MGLEIIGAGLNYKASKKAAKAQEEAAGQASEVAKESTDKQLELMRQIWEQQQKDQAPYLQQGQKAIGKLSDLTLGGDNFQSYLKGRGLGGGQFNVNNPQYQFLQKQGMQALDRSAAARGMGYSGAQMKALNEYGQGLASQQYDKEYNRAAQEYGNYYNRLASLSQGGQQAAQSLGGIGSNYSANAANTLGSLSSQLQNNIGQGANARASGYIGKANAIGGGIQQMTDNAFRFLSLPKFGG